ncbi:MAG: hypothetical protein ACKODX_09870 [Gemmata sp.]
MTAIIRHSGLTALRAAAYNFAPFTFTEPEMGGSARGRVIPLSPARRVVCELMRHARRVPSLPLSRECDVRVLAAARKRSGPGASWVGLFMKAYGVVAQRHPALRRAYIPYPYPRLYEHPHSTCTVLVEREWHGDPVVLGAKVVSPETAPLALIDEHLRRFREDDVWSVSPFRQVLRLGGQPWPLRRFAFWSSLYFSGAKRAKRFGTFMLSSLGAQGVEQQHPLTPLTTYLTFGPIRADGRVTAKLIYDHRVIDGRQVARALVDLEHVLNTTLADELRAAAPREARLFGALS